MLPDRRAVVFDLDDTLYPYRRFKTSGFVAVAAHLEIRCGLDSRLGFAALTGAARGATRGHELEACLDQYDLPAAWLPDLVDVFRHHAPRLRRPSSVTRALGALRLAGWRIGVLTNGQPTIQARKVDALGLTPLVDTVVYAASCGSGEGKPDPETFAEVVRRLDVVAGCTVFVGNDERCDVQGARLAGMRAVRCDVWAIQHAPTVADAVVTRFPDIPTLAHALLEEASNRHAA
jgi:putative hydrolase of the HAD superfamily